MPDPVFLAMSVITVAGAILALEAKELVYGALGLGGSLFGVAALFVLLDATFPAMFQITVYIGAVVVLILFTVMLVRREKWIEIKERVTITGLAGAVAISLGISVMTLLAGLGRWTGPNTPAIPYAAIGDQIIAAYWPVLMVLALVLTASIIGALTLAKLESAE
jgi:NADH-quinone oxidoreductase subunit J